MEKDFSKDILDRINEKKLEPKARWGFILKDYFLWALGIISLLVGGLAFSAVIFIMKNNDWDVYMHFSDSLVKYFFITAPYTWILLLGLFILAAHYNYKHTEKGYKMAIHKIVLIMIAISSVLGIGFYNIGMGRAIDEGFANRSKLYREAFNNRQHRWHQPDKGLLAGFLTHENGKFFLDDYQGKQWTIIPPEELPYSPIEKLAEGRKVRLVGEQIDENSFRADKLLPFLPMQGKLDMMKGLRGEGGSMKR